jgi:hypothetical protein
VCVPWEGPLVCMEPRVRPTDGDGAQAWRLSSGQFIPHMSVTRDDGGVMVDVLLSGLIGGRDGGGGRHGCGSGGTTKPQRGT